jgi:hypothetical protein
MTSSASKSIALRGNPAAIIDGRSAMAADKLGIGSEPLDGSRGFCAAVRAGDFEFKVFRGCNEHWEIQIYHPAENLLDQPSTLMAVATKMVAAATYP